MGNDNKLESLKDADSAKDGKSSDLSAYSLERSCPTQTWRDLSNALVEKGILPALDFLDMSPEVRIGLPPSREEIKIPVSKSIIEKTAARPLNIQPELNLNARRGSLSRDLNQIVFRL